MNIWDFVNYVTAERDSTKFKNSNTNKRLRDEERYNRKSYPILKNSSFHAANKPLLLNKILKTFIKNLSK